MRTGARLLRPKHDDLEEHFEATDGINTFVGSESYVVCGRQKAEYNE